MSLFECDFCGKTKDEVPILIVGPDGIAICNECVELSQEIIVDHFQDKRVRFDEPEEYGVML